MRIARLSIRPMVLWLLIGCLGMGLVVTSESAHAAYSTRVEAAQERLLELGYDPGPVDGLMGGRTRRALQRFQRDRGLDPDGILGPNTRAALERATPEPSEPTTPEIPASGAAPSATPAPEPVATPIPAPTPTIIRPAAPATPAKRGTDTEPQPVGQVLTYRQLDWHPPQSGPDALRRFDSEGASDEMERGSDELVVPDPKHIYILMEGESIPGFDCDPAAGRISVEFVFGGDGPIVFQGIDGSEYCRFGFGIVLAVGRELDMRQGYWGEVEYPAGRMRLTARGLEYVTR